MSWFAAILAIMCVANAGMTTMMDDDKVWMQRLWSAVYWSAVAIYWIFRI